MAGTAGVQAQCPGRKEPISLPLSPYPGPATPAPHGGLSLVRSQPRPPDAALSLVESRAGSAAGAGAGPRIVRDVGTEKV